MVHERAVGVGPCKEQAVLVGGEDDAGERTHDKPGDLTSVAEKGNEGK